MTAFIIHLHNHAGWYTQTIEADNLADAIKKALHKRATFLSRKYNGKYKIEHDDPNSGHPRFRVVWDDDAPKHFAWRATMCKGDVWWSDRFQVGEPDDCTSCGGTGVNHYNLFMQCWSCGDSTLKGKGTGKNKQYNSV